MKALLKKLLKPKFANESLKGLSAHQRVYCIGDIHGRLDLIQDVHVAIMKHAAGFKGQIYAVYLGDYIDRGPQSKQVVDFLLTSPLEGVTSVHLLGNHEQTLLQFMYGHDIGLAHDWFRFGGIATLQSYGVALTGIPTSKDIDRLRAELSDKCPTSHKQFYHALKINFELDGYYFVHAGIKPKVALDEQNPEDMLWIREEFLTSSRHHGKVVVHGHSVTEKPEILSNRIGLDTGAYSSNLLTCAVFEGEAVYILNAA